jgi:hypothetical protein
MAFGEALRLKVKKKAHFRCCRCQAISVEIHHIIPQSEDGPDTEENAAPLCRNCHDLVGGHPGKKAEVRQMRDAWYAVCAKKSEWFVDAVMMAVRPFAFPVGRSLPDPGLPEGPSLDLLVFMSPGPGHIGIAVEPWPEIVPRADVDAVAARLRRFIETPNAVVQDAIVVTDDGVRVQGNNGQLVAAWEMKSQYMFVHRSTGRAIYPTFTTMTHLHTCLESKARIVP